MAAVYYIIESYEAAFTTGSRKSNYHCYCLIFDEQGQEIKNHALYDVFYGKWARCQTIIGRWQKAVDKAKLQRLKTNPPPAQTGAKKEPQN